MGKIVSKKENVYQRISRIIETARNNIARSVNFEMVQAYWLIGREIVTEEQAGARRADYGRKLLESLSLRLARKFGEGFDPSNLWNIRRFYCTFPILDALRLELSWTHYRILMRVENPQARKFYEIECVKNNWSSRELERQKGSLLFERLALSKDKKAVMRLAQKGQEIQTYADMIKDPYVLEFTGLPPRTKLYENKLEQALIDNLTRFLLELGKGFTFVARQKRISLEDDHFYIDLVFYNFILKCFVLIDLKVGELTHQDIGQMDMYVRLYEDKFRNKGDNPSIGIILCAQKDETVVKYSVLKDGRNLFALK